jgi:hypothetical protein
MASGRAVLLASPVLAGQVGKLLSSSGQSITNPQGTQRFPAVERQDRRVDSYGDLTPGGEAQREHFCPANGP